MKNNGNTRRVALLGRTAFILISFLLVVSPGCTNSASNTPTPGLLPAGQVDAGVTPTPAPSAKPASTLTPAPPSTTQPPQTRVTPPLPLTLKVLAPVNAFGLEVGFARVMGTTSGTLVRVNGLTTQVADNGRFQRDLSLMEGVNFIEVIASDDYDQTISQQLTVYVVAPTANLPFTILYPLDGLEISGSTVTVVGVTRPDAVVGVNDVPAEIDAAGVFSATVELEEGSNLIEVVAADIEGNVRFQTIAVFYLP